MSQRIDDAIDVLVAIRQAHENEGRESLRSIRIGAVKSVADARGVEPKTIADVYIRRLRPYVKKTADFDRLVLEWLNGRAMNLHAALDKCSLDAADRGRIKAFFEADKKSR